LARHERDIQAGAHKPLSFNELLELLRAEGEVNARERDNAIACFLSAGEGWREAKQRIGGAFARAESGLRKRRLD
jgi:hypothetical protein